VRALAPAPGAASTFHGTPLKVLRAAPRPWPNPDEPRTPGLIALDPGGVPVVAAADGGVALLEVALSGRRRMPGEAWARGARLGAGETLA